jgi:ribosomal protein S1
VAKTKLTASKTKTSEKTSKEGAVTMADLLAKYDKALKTFSIGEKVKGKVIALIPGRVIIEIGGKSEGIVAEKAYKESENYIKTLKPGDEVEGSVIVTENSEGFTVLSFRQSSQDALWDEVQSASESRTPVSVYGKMSTPSGIVVEYKSVSGFLPKSQLGSEVTKNPASLVGRRFDAVIIDFDKEGRRIIFSEKEVSEKDELDRERAALEQVKTGESYGGTVSAIYDFGVFVAIPLKIGKGKSGEETSIEGLVHISELSWDKVDYPGEIYKVGQEVKVLVIGKDKGRLALSIKQIAADPWKTVGDRIKKDQKIKGKVSKVTDFGVFVILEAGIEGLIHMTKIPPGQKYQKGDTVEVYVEEINGSEKRISLGLVLTAKPLGYK